jgi:hypothetical protein
MATVDEIAASAMLDQNAVTNSGYDAMARNQRSENASSGMDR